jgi:hypothetical protein
MTETRIVRFSLPKGITDENREDLLEALDARVRALRLREGRKDVATLARDEQGSPIVYESGVCEVSVQPGGDHRLLPDVKHVIVTAGGMYVSEGVLHDVSEGGEVNGVTSLQMGQGARA